MRSGFRLPWLALPSSLSPVPIPSRPPFSKEGQEAIDLEVEALLEKGAVSLAALPSPGFYGRLFVVPKNSGGFRPVLDLSVLNLFFEKKRPTQRKSVFPSFASSFRIISFTSVFLLIVTEFCYCILIGKKQASKFLTVFAEISRRLPRLCARLLT